MANEDPRDHMSSHEFEVRFIGDPSREMMERVIDKIGIEPGPVLLAFDPGGFDDTMAIMMRQACATGTAAMITSVEHESGNTAAEISLKIQMLTPRLDAVMDVVRVNLDGAFNKLVRSALLNLQRVSDATRERRRPQQRSAKMRRHARIVRSRMTPTVKRERGAAYQRLKHDVKLNNIRLPDPLQSYRDLFT